MNGEWLPDHVQALRDALESFRLEPVITRRPRGGPLDPTLICVLRDEGPRLKPLLAHHRALGVRDFIMIDNGSVDGGRDWLAQQHDVTLYDIREPFSEPRKQLWINHAIRERDPDGWYLLVDADELLVYDGCDGHPLRDLVARAERLGLHRLRGMMIDLYPPGPLLAEDDEDDARRRHDRFDPDGYEEWRAHRMIRRTGGPRGRVFSIEGEPLRPELTKYPLFRAAPGVYAANAHHLYPFEDNFDASCLLGLLHEKFRFDFSTRMRRAVAEGQYWRGSLEWRSYAEALERDPDLSLEYDGSRRYRTPSDLVAAGLIEPLHWPA